MDGGTESDEIIKSSKRFVLEIVFGFFMGKYVFLFDNKTSKELIKFRFKSAAEIESNYFFKHRIQAGYRVDVQCKEYVSADKGIENFKMFKSYAAIP